MAWNPSYTLSWSATTAGNIITATITVKDAGNVTVATEVLTFDKTQEGAQDAFVQMIIAGARLVAKQVAWTDIAASGSLTLTKELLAMVMGM